MQCPIFLSAIFAGTTMTAIFCLCYAFGLFIMSDQVYTLEVSCPDGRLCPARWHCCAAGCCAPPPSGPRDDTAPAGAEPWNLQWQALACIGAALAVVVICWLAACRRSPQGVYLCALSCCVRRTRSAHDSAGSLYPPPRYSRCSSFHNAPPPYAEVTSKPELYPLVITCGEGDHKNGGNCLLVHYFRNYVIRDAGSLSATSTAESLNSSFICNATNEANTIEPPPYSRTSFDECDGVGCGRSLLRSLSSLTEPRVQRVRSVDARPIPTFTDMLSSPVETYRNPFDLELELIDCERYCDGGCRPRVGTSPTPTHRTPSDGEDSGCERGDYRLRNLYVPSIPGTMSPPQPTSPTDTSRAAREERRRRAQIKKQQRSRKSSLYMPLSTPYPGRMTRIPSGARVSSRSAPATPCGGFVPNFLTLPQRVSSSRNGSRSSKLEEEHDLLIGGDNENGDPKF